MKPGIHTIDAATYHADPTDGPSLSASIARLLVQASPAHAREAHPRLRTMPVKPEDESKYEIGTAAHKLLLEGESVIEVCLFDNWKTKPAQEARRAAREYGRIPLLAAQADEVEAMVAAIRAQVATLDPVPFTLGAPEQTLIWQEGDVTCRARLDWLTDDRGSVFDLKTTSRYAVGWDRGPLYDHGCDVQAAFYLRGLRALGYQPDWTWIVVETKPPYGLIPYALSEPVRALGDAKVDKALAVWRRCLETNEWPGYPLGVVDAELPAWIEARWLEHEAREEIAA